MEDKLKHQTEELDVIKVQMQEMLASTTRLEERYAQLHKVSPADLKVDNCTFTNIPLTDIPPFVPQSPQIPIPVSPSPIITQSPIIKNTTSVKNAPKPAVKNTQSAVKDTIKNIQPLPESSLLIILESHIPQPILPVSPSPVVTQSPIAVPQYSSPSMPQVTQSRPKIKEDL